MAFKPKSESEEAMSDINVTPLVDVMLVLVIILLVTAPLLTQSVHVALPETTKTVANTKDQSLQLGIDAQGQISLNKRPIADLAALETTLKNELKQKPDTSLYLYSDKNVVYGKVAEVMATVQHAGITKLSFVTVEK